MKVLKGLCVLLCIGYSMNVPNQELKFIKPQTSFESKKVESTKWNTFLDYLFAHPKPTSLKWIPLTPDIEFGIVPEVFNNVHRKPEVNISSKPDIDILMKQYTDAPMKLDINVSPEPEVNISSKPDIDILMKRNTDASMKLNIDVSPEAEFGKQKRSKTKESESWDSEIIEETLPEFNQVIIRKVKKDRPRSDKTGNGIFLYDDETGNCGCENGEDEDSSESIEEGAHIIRFNYPYRDTPQNRRIAEFDLKSLRKGEKWYHQTQMTLIPLSQSVEEFEEVLQRASESSEVKKMIEIQMQSDAEAMMTEALDLEIQMQGDAEVMTEVPDANEKSKKCKAEETTEDPTNPRRQALLFNKECLEAQLGFFEEYMASSSVDLDELSIRLKRIEPILDQYLLVNRELSYLEVNDSPETLCEFERRYYRLLALASGVLATRNAPKPTEPSKSSEPSKSLEPLNQPPVMSCQSKPAEDDLPNCCQASPCLPSNLGPQRLRDRFYCGSRCPCKCLRLF